MEHELPDLQQLSNGGEGRIEQNDGGELNESDWAHHDDIDREDSPSDGIKCVDHQDDELGGDHIAENDPIHD